MYCETRDTITDIRHSVMKLSSFSAGMNIFARNHILLVPVQVQLSLRDTVDSVLVYFNDFITGIHFNTPEHLFTYSFGLISLKEIIWNLQSTLETINLGSPLCSRKMFNEYKRGKR